MPREISQTRKDKYCMTGTYVMRLVKFIEIESGSVVTRGKEEASNGELDFRGTEFQLGKVDKSWR